MLHHHSRLNNNLVIVAIGAIVAALSVISCTIAPTPAPPFIALAGTPVPVPAEAISPENAGRVVQLARWGKGTINQVAWSPDGKQLAVASSIGVYFYDAQTLQQTRFVETRSIVESVAFSPDGKVLAAGLEDGQVPLWDVASGRELRVLSGHTLPVNSLAFSATSPGGSAGNQVLAAAAFKTVKLWDVASGRELHTIDEEQGIDIYSIAFLPALPGGTGSQMLAYGGGGEEGGMVKLWDVVGGRELRTLSGLAKSVKSIAFSPVLTESDLGMTLVTGGGDGIKLWDVADGRELDTIEGPTDYSNYIEDLAFSPDGKLLASVSRDDTVKLWDFASAAVASRRELRTLSVRDGDNASLAFSPDGKTLAIGVPDAVKLWDLASAAVASWRELRAIEGHTERIEDVAFSPDGTTLASGSRDGTARLWDVMCGCQVLTIGVDSGVYDVAFLPDGNTLATLTSGVVQLWDVTSGHQLRVIEGPTNARRIAFSPDGELLAMGEGGNTLRLWEVASGRELRVLEGYEASNPRGNIAFSPDGKTLAWVSFDHTVKLWDVAGERELHTLVGHTRWVNGIAFSPDGKTLASGSVDDTVRLWDVASGREIRALPAAFYVYSIAFSPDGHVLAIGGYRAVQLLDMASGRELRAFGGHTTVVDSLAFSPDGRLLASASGDGTVRLWGVK